MGYRSDAALAVKGNALCKFRKKLAELPEKERGEIAPLFNEWADKHFSEIDGECWFWSDIKWYTGWPEHYPDIDFVDKVLDESDEEDYYFVRFGEEYDDNEIRGLWWDNPFGITLCREIVLDC